MYTTTVGLALAGDITMQRIAEHYLYIVREDETVFYVGQSLYPLARLQEHLIGMSALGNLICEHWPTSQAWRYDLLRLAECAAYIEGLTGRQDWPRRQLGSDPVFFEGELNAVEEDLIDFLHPCLNVAGNRHATPLPARYRQRAANLNIKLPPPTDKAELERLCEQLEQQRLAQRNAIAQLSDAGRPAGVPPGSVDAYEFAAIHEISRARFWRHLVTGLKTGQGQNEHVEHLAIPQERRGGMQRWLTPEQQAAALDFWQRHGVAFHPRKYTVSLVKALDR